MRVTYPMLEHKSSMEMNIKRGEIKGWETFFMYALWHQFVFYLFKKKHKNEFDRTPKFSKVHVNSHMQYVFVAD